MKNIIFLLVVSIVFSVFFTASASESCRALVSAGVPVYSIEETEDTYEVNFSSAQKKKLRGLQDKICATVIAKVKAGKFTWQELKSYRAHVVVDPGLPFQRYYRLYHWMLPRDVMKAGMVERRTKPGVALRFGYAFFGFFDSGARTLEEKKSFLQNLSRDKGLNFTHASTAETLTGWLIADRETAVPVRIFNQEGEQISYKEYRKKLAEGESGFIKLNGIGLKTISSSYPDTNKGIPHGEFMTGDRAYDQDNSHVLISYHYHWSRGFVITAEKEYIEHPSDYGLAIQWKLPL